MTTRLTSTWPRLRCDAGLEEGEEGEYEENCVYATVLCTIIMMCKYMSSSYRLIDCIGLWSCLAYLFIIRAPLYLWSSWCYRHSKFFWWHLLLYLLVSWAWCDWHLTWLTNHCPSVLWHCWLGHMTYNMSSGMLNTTVPYRTILMDRYIVWNWTCLAVDVADTKVCPVTLQCGNDRADGCPASTTQWTAYHQRSPHMQNTILG